MNLLIVQVRQTPSELARILRELADKVEDGVSKGDEFRAVDINGNKVGDLIIK